MVSPLGDTTWSLLANSPEVIGISCNGPLPSARSFNRRPPPLHRSHAPFGDQLGASMCEVVSWMTLVQTPVRSAMVSWETCRFGSNAGTGVEGSGIGLLPALQAVRSALPHAEHPATIGIALPVCESAAPLIQAAEAAINLFNCLRCMLGPLRRWGFFMVHPGKSDSERCKHCALYRSICINIPLAEFICPQVRQKIRRL